MFDRDDLTGGRFFEGFSNEVTALLAVLMVILFSAIYLLYQQRNRIPQAIHPSLLPLVQEFRNLFFRNDDNANGAGVQAEASSLTAQARINSQPYNMDRTCPICFGAALFAVQTNCGHLFCLACILGYWRHSASLLTPVKCAVCRTTVSMLMPLYSDTERRDPENAEARQQADNELNDYNRRFSGAPRPIMDYIRDLPVLLPYLVRQLFSVDGLMWMFRIRVLFLLLVVCLYILSPFDILPEAMFGVLGILDDILIALVVLLYSTILFRHFMAQRGDAQQ